MKILIVVPDFGLEPVGLVYIATVLKKAGHDVVVLNKNETDKLNSMLTQEKYDFVATGGMSIHYHLIEYIVSIAKEHETKVIIGGAIVTSEPELMSGALNVDYSVIGEGEDTIVDLLSCIENNGVLENVPGIGFFREDKFVLTEKRPPVKDLDDLPLPDWELFDFDTLLDTLPEGYSVDVFDHPRNYPILASRSCPYRCTFCYHPLGDKYRQRSIDSIMNELMVVIPKYRINIVGISDELFARNEERVFEFCSKFKEFTDTLSWDVRWACQMRVDRISEAMLERMKDAGCYLVSYGFESYSDTVLKSMKKHIKPEQIHRAIHLTHDKEISIQGSFIFGDPAETKETALETLEFWKEHGFACINLLTIMPCPGSDIYHHCIEQGLIKDKLEFLKNNHLYKIYNMTQMSDDDFSQLLFEIQRLKASLKYTPHAIPMIARDGYMKIKCPHCNAISEYRNVFALDAMFLKLPGISPNNYYFCSPILCRKCRRRYYSASRLYLIFSRTILFFLTPAIYKGISKIRWFIKGLRANKLHKKP